MDKSSNEAYLYQISTNPIHQNGTLLSMHDQDTGFGFGGELSIVTGMNNSLETTIAAIKNSTMVYISGEVDATTLLKRCYPYDMAQLNCVSFKTFIQIVEEQL